MCPASASGNDGFIDICSREATHATIVKKDIWRREINSNA